MTGPMSHEQPMAGWYPHPSSPGQLRYWTGDSWTAHVCDDPRADEPEPLHVAEDPAAVPLFGQAQPEQPEVAVERAETAVQVPEVDVPAVAGPVEPVAFTGTVAELEAEFALPSVDPPQQPVLVDNGPGVGIQPERMAVDEPAHGASQEPISRQAPEPGPVRGFEGAIGGFDGVAPDVADPMIVPRSTPGRRSMPVRRSHRRLWAFVGLAVAAVVAGLLAWGLRSQPSDVVATAAVTQSPAPTPQAYRTGAAYVATTPAPSGALPTCSGAAASWTESKGSVLVTVTVPGPKQVAVVVIDKTNPQRPNRSHGAATIKPGQSTASLTIEAPAGGIGRVQVGLQGDQGIQQCNAPQGG